VTTNDAYLIADSMEEVCNSAFHQNSAISGPREKACAKFLPALAAHASIKRAHRHLLQMALINNVHHFVVL
jgi:hypothetical protein